MAYNPNNMNYGGGNGGYNNNQQPPMLPGGNLLKPNIAGNFMNDWMGASNTMYNNTSGYQHPFTGSQQNWDNQSQFQNNSNGFQNTPYVGANTGYRQPFNVSNNAQLPGMQHNNRQLILLDENNKIRGGDNLPPPFLQFSDLTGAQMNFIRQIETFIISNNLQLDAVLQGAPFNHSPLEMTLSSNQFQSLGRMCRVDILDYEQIKDLEIKLKDPANPKNDQISLPVLKRVLSQSGAVVLTHQTEHNQEILVYQLQKLRDLMTSHNKKTALELFDGEPMVPDGDDKCIDKEVFVRKATEAAMSLEQIDKAFSTIVTKDGKASLKKLQEELQKPALVQNLTDSDEMTQENAEKLVSETFELLKRFIAYNEVNLFDLFDDVEQDDGYFNREEFTSALSKCHFKVIGLEHEDRIHAVFKVYDKQRTRRFDYQQFLYDFYQRANAKKVVNPGERFFNIFEHTRQYLKGKRQLSLSSTFLNDYLLNDMPELRELINSNQEISYDSQKFHHTMNKAVNCKQLDSGTFQSFMVLMNYQQKFEKVDYIKFCDFVGYEQPMKSDKERARKVFYKTFLKDLQGNFNFLQQSFRNDDINLLGRCHVSIFTNIVLSFSPMLQNEQDIIRQIANEFMMPGEIIQVDYLKFLQKIEQEIAILNAIRRVYISFNQILQFQESTDLYQMLFQKYDKSGERKFSAEQLKRLFMEQLGISAEPAEKDALNFIKEFNQGQIKQNYVRFADIEPDFREYIENERRLGRIRSLTGLPSILRAIKVVYDNGKSLRQIFGKTKIEDNDYINHYQMTKTMNDISKQTGQTIDDTSIQLFSNLISVNVNQPSGGGSPGKKDKLEVGGGNRQISFSNLQDLFIQNFKLERNDEKEFTDFSVQKLQTHISKVVLEMTRLPTSRFNLREIFFIPISDLKDFKATLNAEPFVCSKDFSDSAIEALAKKYQAGFERVNTQNFIQELENNGKNLKDKDFIYSELKKNILKKNSTIEKVFEEAISDIKRFRLDQFRPEEIYLVFVYLEIKSVSLQQLKDVLSNSQEVDKEGKYSVPDFIKDFKLLNNTDPAAARKGRKFYQTREEIIKRIVFVIEHRNIQNFGQLLADQDLEGTLSISRDQFYRLIDSFKFGLGEADIQELMRGYAIKNFLVDIEKFKDDLNTQIVDPQFKVELRSKLTSLLNSRVVEPIEEKEIKQVKIDPKVQAQFQAVAREIICGLFVVGKSTGQWFITFGTFKKSALTNQEFIKAVQQLEAKVDSSFALSYYENLVLRQSQQLGYSESLLLIDQLELLLSRDCNLSSSPSKMIDEILLDIAFHLTDNKIPIADKIKLFDPTNQGTISRTDFTSNFLDNYLQLQNILSNNEKNLLASKYAPNPSILMFKFELFIADLKRKQDESKGGVHIYMTQHDVDFDDKIVNQEPVESSLEQEETSQYVAEVVSMPALSKRNTHVTELTAKKPSLKAGIQIGSFLFDDIMMYTFQRGKSVEEFFSQYAKISQGELVLNKDDFARGITTLGVDWSTNVRRVSDIFDQLDIAANRGTSCRFITVTDISEAVLFNAAIQVDDKLSEYLFSIYRVLNEGKKESKLQDLFNFLNTNRDETCLNSEFKKIILDLVDPQRTFKVVNDHQFEQLLNRYRVTNTVPEFRVNFEKFHRDIQYASKGISIGMIWAIDLASNIMKVKQITEQQTYDQIFNKYSRMSGTLMFEEFRKCMIDMKLNECHKEQEFQDFFNNVAQGSTAGNIQINTNKVAISQMKEMITKLAPPNAGVLIQQIVHVIWTETKKHNKSLQSVMSSFSEFDVQKQGIVTYQNFKNVLISRLNVINLIELDFQILAKRYMVKTTSTNQDIESQMIQFNIFIQDYQAFEKMGLKVVFDPLKQNLNAPPAGQHSSSPLDAKAKPLSKESQLLYKQMQDYFIKHKGVDLLCDALGKLDSAAHRGTLPAEQIRKVFAHFKANLDDANMNKLLQPLPVDPLDQSYSYIVLIELAFGKQKAVDTYNKFRMGMTTQVAQQGKPLVQAVMSQRFKDDIEVKLTFLLSWVHQISKGSYILTQQQFLAVFEPVGILVTAQDRELLNQTFQMLKQQQTQTVNFNTFLTHFAISDVTAGVIAGLQKVISDQNIRVSDEDTGSTLFTKDLVSLEDFNKFLETQKIEIPGFTPRQINDAFSQMSDRKGVIEKNRLIRILKNEREFVRVNAQAAQPFIVSEFINHIVNNKINIFTFIRAKSQSLIIGHFNELIKSIKYIPSNPKDLPQLIKHFADQESNANAEPKSVSIPKILAEIRKKDPQYALEITIINQAANTLGVKLANNPAQPTAAQKLTPQQVAQGQLSSCTQRVKDILFKINDQLKRSGLSNSQLFTKIDVNGTSTIEKQEFSQFFQKDLIVKGLTSDDINLAFDSIDMNKDGVLSINEFCLLLEGVQQNFDQKLRQFDPELEKTLREEVNQLFDFFDTNKDNMISQQELDSALKSQNPNVTLNETLTIMKLADRDMNKQIDRKEFTEMMLPMLKAEVINRDQNLDDLRRLFKEFDLDQSNYLSKEEFREALVRLGIVLSDVQVDDLLKEVDLDQNNVIDIDEFIAFLAIADQVRFSNPANKAILIKIKHARKLQPIDFYNCFKNLPQSFQTSILTETMEKSNKHTPSYGLYPQFDGKTMNYRELQKLEEFGKNPAKKFIEMFHPQLGAEITIEEATGVPLPKKEDFDWGKIINREVRVVLVDAKNQDLVSNVFMSQAAWNQAAPSKWTFNASEIQSSGRQFVIRTDSLKTEPNREVHLVFELILYTKLSDGVQTQQVCCAWASIPLNQLDKQAKMKISLKGGRVLQEVKISQDQIHQEKKGFEFLRKLTASSDEPLLTISIKPFIKLTEQQQLHLSMLPNNVLVNRKLLSFAAIFRLLAFRRLTKSQQQMLAPGGNFAIAQFRKIFDSPDVNLILADCWEHYESTAPKGQFTVDEYLGALEEFLVKTYAIIYCEGFHFDHVYPTRGANSTDSDLFILRETMIKQQLAPQKYKKIITKTTTAATGVNKENNKNANNEPLFEDYKPFNIAEMEIPIVGVIDSVEAKQDELTKMYQQMGLLNV